MKNYCSVIWIANEKFWLERIFLEKERSSKRTMVFDIGRKNIKMKFFPFLTGDIGL